MIIDNNGYMVLHKDFTALNVDLDNVIGKHIIEKVMEQLFPYSS